MFIFVLERQYNFKPVIFHARVIRTPTLETKYYCTCTWYRNILVLESARTTLSTVLLYRAERRQWDHCNALRVLGVRVLTQSLLGTRTPEYSYTID
jgi:hypothetical protein